MRRRAGSCVDSGASRARVASLSTHVSTVAAVAIMVCLVATTALAQEASWWGRADRLQVEAFQAPGGQFGFEMPRRDWELGPGGGPVVAVLAQRRLEAIIFIEHARLNQPLAPEDITDLFAELEADRLRQQQPGLAEVETRILDVESRRIVALQYRRVGPKGAEIVRQYSMAEGDDLFRVVCSSLTARFSQHEPVCKHVATTFQARGGR